MLKGARYVGRGLADTYEHLAYFALMSLLWWLCAISVLLGPSATLALFTHADPRIGTLKERLAFGETVHFVWHNLWRGWRLTLITLPVLLLLSYNIAFYGARASAIGIISPLWFLLFVIGVVITASAFAIQALRDEERAVAAARLAALMTGARLGHALLMMLLIVAVGVLFAILVVPFILFMPAFVAAVFNRFVLSSLRVAIPNPLEPTAERTAEGKERRKWFGP